VRCTALCSKVCPFTVTRFPWNSKIWKPNSWCTKAEQYTCIYYNLALYITPVVFTYGMNITRLTRHMSLVEQELLNPPIKGRRSHDRLVVSFTTTYAISVCHHWYCEFKSRFLVEFVFQSLVLCVCFVDRCLSFCTFSFGHCVVCSSSLYRLWIPYFAIPGKSCYSYQCFHNDGHGSVWCSHHGGWTCLEYMLWLTSLQYLIFNMFQ
jgi:hypothetical protein